MIGCVERIKEAQIVPLLESLLEQYPFRILGFHSDNGSESINPKVAKLLNRRLIDFAKSRSRQTNDNALVESKNGSIVRKHFGHGPIPKMYAEMIHEHCIDHLNPYINFHRPCYFPKSFTDRRGKVTKRYPYSNMKTPYEKLKSLPDAESYLKEGITFNLLDEKAQEMSDNEAAEKLNQARDELFRAIFEREPGAA